MDDHSTPEKNYSLERLIFFSDGVFAIVITLLALELKVPEHWDGSVSALWHGAGRQLSALAISFWAVGLFWNDHRVQFSRIVEFKPGLAFLNLLFLGLITLLPFGAQLIYESGLSGEPAAIYVGLIAAIALAQAAMWGYSALFAGLVRNSFSRAQRWIVFLIMLATPILVSVWALLMSNERPMREWLVVAAGLAAVRVLRGRFERETKSGAARRLKTRQSH